ncbi:MAG: stage II sporulation protein M, partial [Cyclobacteriaceae bacterium]|nr:stage II sporulation protein M [Cyclobacteriaceae bacterium]
SDIHLSIYKNKKEESSRFINFWKYELPQVMSESLKYVLISFIIFTVSGIIGALSAAHDDTFVRLIMGDQYVNETLSNIDKGDPMAVYKQMGQTEMFLGITINNIRVSFIVFIAGIFTSIAAGYLLFSNGIMLGAFQYFFYQKGLLMTSVLTIWIHGTLEISAIIIAGAAGIIMGNGLLFPGTYSRLQSFKNGAKKGLKMVIGLVPVFIMAGFLEGFVTRMTGIPDLFKIAIILGSAIFIFIYFIFIPLKIRFNGLHAKNSFLQNQELQSEA